MKKNIKNKVNSLDDFEIFKIKFLHIFIEINYFNL
jgi:hypothetical protein